MIDIVSDALLFPVAALIWRWSKLMSCALQLALIAAVAVRLGIEEARVVSALTGLVGAIEIGIVLDNPRDVDDLRRAEVGALLLASMASDGVSWLVYRWTGDWTLPSIQIPVLIWIGAICWKGDPK